MRHHSPRLLPQVTQLLFSKGPILEQYMAEEALGLAKSLGWTILKGPFWNPDNKTNIEIDEGKKSTHLRIESNVDELQDGDYIKTSLGSGILHVILKVRRKME